MKLTLEHRHSDYGADAGGYSVLKLDGEWVGRVIDDEVAKKLVREFKRLSELETLKCR